LKSFNDILNDFEPVQLSQIDSVKLLNRVDTKFLIKVSDLSDLLLKLEDDYFILEINGVRMSNYRTLYYDTPYFYFYYQHQCGRFSRLKIRLRTYMETGQSFLEIKVKNNHSKTSKNRIPIPDSDSLKEKSYKNFLKSCTDKYKEIIPVVDVAYSRITLVNKAFTERLTIDTGLNFKNETSSAGYSGLCILELKQDKSARSPLREILREKRIFESSLSKYCLGIASLYPEVKKNNIKEKIRFVNKLCSGEDVIKPGIEN